MLDTAMTSGTERRPVLAASKPITVALVNDYEIILQGLHSILAPFSNQITVVEHEVGGTPDVCADIALFDTFAGRRDALDRAKQMVDEAIVDRIVMYTWDAADEFISIARNVGVAAVILKSVNGEALADQLLQVAAGDRIGLDEGMRPRRKGPAESLSLREQEVLALLALGYSNPEIANELFLSVDTVKTYVRRVFSKLGVNNRTNAALLAARYDLAPPARRLARLPGGADHRE
ncbi:MAG: response regulator transcription factor [Ilumatobacteraceae bacterium]